jgi:hypothetical protein
MEGTVMQALSRLAGQVLWNAGRTTNLEWFHFGQRREVQGRFGEVKLVGEYALHVQCAWRITHKNIIVVASGDRFFPSGDPFQDIQDFEWDRPGSNRCDEKVALLFSGETPGKFIVEAVKSDLVGGLTLVLTGDYTLDVFPDTSVDGEYWRFFQPYTSHPHLIMTSKGVEIS